MLTSEENLSELSLVPFEEKALLGTTSMPEQAERHRITLPHLYVTGFDYLTKPLWPRMLLLLDLYPKGQRR